MSLTHQWSDDGVEPHADGAHRLDAEEYPWLFERLQGFQNAAALPVAGLPEDASVFRRLLQDEDVESALVLPLVSDWTLLGALSFQAIPPTMTLDDRRINLARTFADMVGHALAQAKRERELKGKNERLEEFASVVSHDLRNPLNVTQASIQLARDRDEPEHLERASEATDRMERIIEQVLTLARLGQDIGETEVVAVTPLARQAWDAVHTADARIQAEAVGDVKADPDRLREALENLFRNAVEHAGEDVTVRFGPLPDGRGFFVEDDGEGIPEGEDVDLFEHGHTTAEDGTGLGLSIVSRIVEAHGWGIQAVASEDGGARFEITTGGTDDVPIG